MPEYVAEDGSMFVCDFFFYCDRFDVTRDYLFYYIWWQVDFGVYVDSIIMNLGKRASVS